MCIWRVRVDDEYVYGSVQGRYFGVMQCVAVDGNNVDVMQCVS